MARSTPRYGHAPFPMRLVPMGSRLEKVGDFTFVVDEGQRDIIIAIPMSKDGAKWSAVPWSIDYKNENGAKWSWDKNEEKPTMSPSLHWVGVWHGHVKKGMLVEA